MKIQFVLVVALAMLAGTSSKAQAAPHFHESFELTHFYRGNLHTHSDRSDGDSPVADVISWYRDHGYDFVAITDHNQALEPREFASLNSPHFQVMAGEEVSYNVQRHPDDRVTPVHVNALCSTRTLGGYEGRDVTEALNRALTLITESGAIAQINHPNFEDALLPQHISHAPPARLFEVANQHPFVGNEGRAPTPLRPGRLSTEQLWDQLLSNGQRLYGTATDDMHDLTRNPGYTPRRPGRGWVQVAAASLDPQALCRALSEGRFYSTTGVTLSQITVNAQTVELTVAPGENTGFFTTKFIGVDGHVFATSNRLQPQYTLQGNERYVRAVVEGPNGQRAWVQPVFVDDN